MSPVKKLTTHKPPSGRFTLLTARELAVELGVSFQTIYRWTSNHQLPYYKMPGGSIRYTLAQVESFFNRNYAVVPEVLYATTQIKKMHTELEIEETI